MKQTILLIDDEVLVMEFYVRALEREGFEVKQFFGPDTALEFIENKKPKLAAIILDIMMLPGKRYENKDTQEGLRTGVYLYEQLKSLYPTVPVIVLTNVSNQETLQQFPQDSLLKVIQKLDYPPLELAQLTNEMVTVANYEVE